MGVQCPTCGAHQRWRETCRRCRCDLGLLRSAVAAYEHHRRECLKLLYAGFSQPALRHARKCQFLKPGTESRRLAALGYLIAENWREALDVAGAAHDERGNAED